MNKKASVRLDDHVKAGYSASNEAVQSALNETVSVEVTRQLANELSRTAIRMTDKGQRRRAAEVLRSRANVIGQQAGSFSGQSRDDLHTLEQELLQDAARIESGHNWREHRKALTSKQYKTRKQQRN